MPQLNGLHDFGALRFGHQAEIRRDAVESVRDAVRESDVRDLYIVIHGAHNDEAVTRSVDEAFGKLLADVWGRSADRAGVLGVHWSSLCFRDEGLPLDEAGAKGASGEGPGITPALREDLFRALPDSEGQLTEILALLDERPARESAFDSLGSALRSLAEIPLQDPLAGFAADTRAEVVPQTDPLMLFEDTRTMCAEFAGALNDVRRSLEERSGKPARHESGIGESAVSEEGTLLESRVTGPRPAQPPSERVRRVGTTDGGHAAGYGRAAQDHAELWDGAHELFRQVIRHVLRRRAGLVGQEGFGPILPMLVEGSDVRLHVIGHGLGGRLAGFALRGLEVSPSEPVLLDSLTLLQGEMSHFAFAGSLPQQVTGHGALWGLQRLVRGPLICTFSHLDFHLGVMYPLSAQMIGDSSGLVSTSRKWGALGFDGVQGVDGPAPMTLRDATEQQSLMQESQAVTYLNVDASEVVRCDELPMGGHHHVFHPQVGRLLWLAAQR
ncbi:hypothetical protein GTY65_22985 [Streptomyces sp. SID8379]|uniref:hypothetical protein n=1 Tax=unclassified Streptomyces TaxID=2593676 RepID=UPI000373CB54|nr:MULTISPECIES: hypothetical protein [unclassified Streptomyces]MYW66910.1 hypothetical protein [Streptomyces sp. SID8379]